MESRSYHLRVGKVNCFAVSDVPSEVMYPLSIYEFPAPVEAVEQALKAYRLEPGRIACDWICLLLEADGERLLVDAGHGSGFGPGTGKLIEHLQQSGIDPESISAVIPTHAHDDHIAGMLTADGKMAFPRARYYLGRTDWEVWQARLQQPRAELNAGEQEYLRTADRYLPSLADKLELVDDGDEILPGIRVMAAPGHTPGHNAIHITSGNEQLLFVGDLVYLPIQVDHPEWSTQMDYDPQQAVTSRKKLLARAAEAHMLVLPSHFPMPGFGYVVEAERGWKWIAL